jgi:hypothetical protein
MWDDEKDWVDAGALGSMHTLVDMLYDIANNNSACCTRRNMVDFED